MTSLMAFLLQFRHRLLPKLLPRHLPRLLPRCQLRLLPKLLLQRLHLIRVMMAVMAVTRDQEVSATSMTTVATLSRALVHKDTGAVMDAPMNMLATPVC